LRHCVGIRGGRKCDIKGDWKYEVGYLTGRVLHNRRKAACRSSQI
jgi:hypothetical protein